MLDHFRRVMALLLISCLLANTVSVSGTERPPERQSLACFTLQALANLPLLMDRLPPKSPGFALRQSRESLLPHVAARFGRFAGGEHSPQYRRLVGPAIEEILGEHFHSGSRFRRAISYLPHGFAFAPLLLATLAHASGLSVPWSLLVAVTASAAYRVRFVWAHPKGQRVVAIVLSAVTVCLPPIVAFHYAFSSMGFALSMVTALTLRSAANVMARFIYSAWIEAMSWWMWQYAKSPRTTQRAIRWSFKHVYVESYDMPWQSEFLLPRVPLWELHKEWGPELVEGLIGTIEVVLHVLEKPLPGITFMGMFLKYLAERLQHILLRRRHGFYESAHSAIQNFKPYTKATASSVDYRGDRQRAVLELEKYFYSVTRWKREKMIDPEDIEVLDFLKGLLSDKDPFVVNEAIRAIGVVAPQLDGGARYRIRTKYYSLLERANDLVRGSVARELSETFIDYENIPRIISALEERRQSQIVQGYLAASLESLLQRRPVGSTDREMNSEIQNLLIQKAEEKEDMGLLRGNCLRALSQLIEVEASTYERVGDLLMNEASPEVREAALSALPQLAAQSPERLKDLSEKLTAFAEGRHAGRANPLQESYAAYLLKNWPKLGPTSSPSQSALRSKVSHESPDLVFITDDDGNAGDYPRRRDLRRWLMQRQGVVVPMNDFRENRGAIAVRIDRLAAVVNHLLSLRAVRSPVWDPVRGKSVARMELILEPVAGAPVVVMGESDEAAALERVLGHPLRTISLSDYTPQGRIDYEALGKSVFGETARHAFPSEDSVIPSAAPHLPKELFAEVKGSLERHGERLETLQAQFSVLFSGEKRADPANVARIVHRFNPTAIISDVDDSLNVAPNSSWADPHHPDNQTTLYFFSANGIAGRFMACITLNTPESLRRGLIRPLSALLTRFYSAILRSIHFFHDAGGGGFRMDELERSTLHRSRRFNEAPRRRLASDLTKAYFKSAGDAVSVRALMRQTLEELHDSFARFTWINASPEHPFEKKLPDIVLKNGTTISGVKLIDTGPQVGLLLPRNHALSESVAQELRGFLAAKIRVNDVYLGFASDFVSASITNKGLRIRKELEKLREAWRKSGHLDLPLRIMVMGDSEADFPLLTLEMEGVEILPIFLGKVPQPGMLNPSFPHARGAALAMASTLSPQAIEEVLRLRFEAFPNKTYEEEIRPAFQALCAALSDGPSKASPKTKRRSTLRSQRLDEIAG